MRRLLPALVLLALPAFAQDAAPPAPGEAPADAAVAATAGDPRSLVERLGELTSDPLFSSATVGVQIVDAATGTEVWGYGQDSALVPASTMKLVSAAVAMRELGPTYRFPTWVMTDAPIDANGVLGGNLYVKGQGDPTMVIERMYRMLLDVKMRGVTEVKGAVVFDDSYFADTTAIPGWPNEDDAVDGPTYFAPLGALSVNYNIASIVLRPGATAGVPAVAAFEVPSSAVQLDNRVVTGSSRSRRSLRLQRELDPTGKIATYILTGTMPLDEPATTLYRALPDPLTNYMGAFEAVARSVGIKVRGGFKPGATPAGAKVLVRSDSDTLTEILAQMNKLSNNFMAEQVLRSVGAEKYGLPGTTEKGVRAIGEYLTSLGLPADSFQIVNGSGLTRETHVRPGVLNAVLVDMYRDPALGSEYVTTLSVGGRDGTLRNRFREDGIEGRVRGKSGTLDGVRCLSGYVEGRDGQTYAFTFLVNDIRGAVARARSAHDRLVVTLSGIDAEVADGGTDDEG